MRCTLSFSARLNPNIRTDTNPHTRELAAQNLHSVTALLYQSHLFLFPGVIITCMVVFSLSHCEIYSNRPSTLAIPFSNPIRSSQKACLSTRGDVWSHFRHALDSEVRPEPPHTDQIDWFPGTVGTRSFCRPNVSPARSLERLGCDEDEGCRRVGLGGACAVMDK